MKDTREGLLVLAGPEFLIIRDDAGANMTVGETPEDLGRLRDA
jgi:hypothetical protein